MAMPDLRRDALANRSRLVAAARDVFSEHGLAVPLEAIAERAGVGIATLYRRFPTRDTLIEAAFEDHLEAYAHAAEEALAATDARTGFAAYVERICAMQAADRGFQDILTSTFPHAPGLEAQRRHGYARSVELIDRAKAAGALRPDFVPEDLILLLLANAGVVAATGHDAPDAWRRFAALMLQAFQAEAPAPLPKPPSPRAMTKVMRRVSR
jgi:AcrR family transcriptional regulator